MPQGDRIVLGRLSPAAFLRRYWHKRALELPQALPAFRGWFDRASLSRLACRDDVESRLVLRERGRWQLRRGPFRAAELRLLPERNWTLLVQGTNLVDARADALLRRFDFLPYARLDDLMVSYAAPGGGVGPHVDSYDVFLLQGFGRRRWRYGAQRDLSLVHGLPLRILSRFEPTHDWTLAGGDLLYLPPHHAHEGVALDACTTYSIGFRAPSAEELGSAFLDHLRDQLALPGRYADPHLEPADRPAEIGPAMQRQVARMLGAIRWTEDDTARFLGRYLSEPKAHVVFARPARPTPAAAFRARIARHGVALDRRTLLLYDRRRLYVNGFEHAFPRGVPGALRRLADRRMLGAGECSRLPSTQHALLHDWYRDGFLAPAA